MRHDRISNDVQWNPPLGATKEPTSLALLSRDVDTSTRQYYPKRSDDQIAQDVMDEFRLEKTIDADSVIVLVKNGALTLMGSVDGSGQKRLIDAVVKRIAGIKSVTDEMKMIFEEPSMRNDEDIRRACDQALGMTVLGANHAITVMVTAGWVTLSGNVAWGFERWSAEDIVSHIPGVNGVNGQITVRSISLQEDIRANIEAALSCHSLDPIPDIQIEVHRSRATLSGFVHSLAQRQAVTNATMSTPGVKHISDHTILVTETAKT